MFYSCVPPLVSSSCVLSVAPLSWFLLLFILLSHCLFVLALFAIIIICIFNHGAALRDERCILTFYVSGREDEENTKKTDV